MIVAGTRLTAVELASGLIFGSEPVPRPPRAPRAADPLAALEDSIRPALVRAPCLVSFSGGRDSSAVLAVAVRLARREGLPLPIPATNRFPRVESSDEDRWQTDVVRALGLREWVKVELDDELDCIGPVAAEAMRRHGLLWPFNAHFVVPLMRKARGGSLLTGIGGDEVLGESQWARAASVLAGRVRPTPRDVRRIALALAPPPARRPVLRRRLEAEFAWLRPEARAAVEAAWIDDSAREPLRWAARIRRSGSLRYLAAGSASLDALGSGEGVLTAHPLIDPRFVDALARLRRTDRFFDRTAAMRTLFRGLLPDAVLARPSKSSFDGAFFNRYSRAFAATWDGSGVDESVVDPDALRQIWRSPSPDARSFLLLQSAWWAQVTARSPVRELTEQVGGAR